MMRSFFLGTLFLLCGGCVEGRACTLIGCADMASLTLRTSDNTWPAGTHRIALTIDGAEHECNLTVPTTLDSDPELACPPAVQAMVRRELECTEHTSGDATSQTCQPLPGQHKLEFQIQDTPTDWRVTVERDGAPWVTREARFSYRETQPNGPGCAPICQQASAEVLLPD